MIPLTHCISSPQKIHHIQLLVAQELAAGGALLGSHEALTMYRFKETTAQLPGYCWLSGSSNLSSGVNERTEHQKKSREVP